MGLLVLKVIWGRQRIILHVCRLPGFPTGNNVKLKVVTIDQRQSVGLSKNKTAILSIKSPTRVDDYIMSIKSFHTKSLTANDPCLCL